MSPAPAPQSQAPAVSPVKPQAALPAPSPKKDDKGNIITQPVDADPNDASLAKTPEEVLSMVHLAADDIANQCQKLFDAV